MMTWQISKATIFAVIILVL